jgi:hypothetical protein
VRAVWQDERWKWSDVHEVISDEIASAQDEDTCKSDLNPDAPEFQSSQSSSARK